MSHTGTIITGEHRTMITLEVLQALVVVIVIISATALVLVEPAHVTSDLLSFVYGGAISYAGGRASTSRQSFRRQGDVTDVTGNEGFMP